MPLRVAPAELSTNSQLDDSRKIKRVRGMGKKKENQRLKGSKGSNKKKGEEVSDLFRLQNVKLSNLVISCVASFAMMNPDTESFLKKNIGVTSTFIVDLSIAVFSVSSLNSHILRPLILRDGLNEKYLQIRNSSSSKIDLVQRMERELNPNEKKTLKIFHHLLPMMLVYVFYFKGKAYANQSI
ncbi:MAG: hypothetical protein VXX85_00110 [Candidatus Margulisiibacteriota bacterium]|nr:hypothetical protein [Candidatus Margulisiibacteriota bacterium]